MNKRIKAKLTGVPDTLLISSRTEYTESECPSGIIHDPMTVKIIDAVDFFSSDKEKIAKRKQEGSTAIRAEILDEQSLISCGSEILELIYYFF